MVLGMASFAMSKGVVMVLGMTSFARSKGCLYGLKNNLASLGLKGAIMLLKVSRLNSGFAYAVFKEC